MGMIRSTVLDADLSPNANVLTMTDDLVPAIAEYLEHVLPVCMMKTEDGIDTEICAMRSDGTWARGQGGTRRRFWKAGTKVNVIGVYSGTVMQRVGDDEI